MKYHKEKYETILVFNGEMLFTFESDSGELQEILLKEGEAHHIPAGKKHRMKAVKETDVFEVSTPQLDDIVRIEDSYGRLAK